VFAIRTNTELRADVHFVTHDPQACALLYAFRDNTRLFGTDTKREALADVLPVRALKLIFRCLTAGGWTLDALMLLSTVKLEGGGVEAYRPGIAALWTANPDLVELSETQTVLLEELARRYAPQAPTRPVW